MIRPSPIAILVIAAAALSAAPAFEAASVRPSQHGRTADGTSESAIHTNAENFTAENATLADLIRWAYNIREYQLSAPDWISKSDGYDITAKAAKGTSRAQLRLMMQTLLADRFKLAVHNETRSLSGFELTVANGGPKLQPATADGHVTSYLEPTKLTLKHVTAARIAEDLTSQLDQLVVDKTGLQGTYDVSLTFGGDKGPSIFTAIQEQLGLKLELAQVPSEALVVDHAEKTPTPN